MRWMALIYDLGEGTRSQPTRTGLSFASLTIGMVALVTLLAILGGVRQKTQIMIGELGVNVFGLVQPAEISRKAGNSPLSRRHADYLTANLPETTVTGMRLDDGAAAGLPVGAVLVATDESLFQVRPWRIVQGRAIDATDIRTRSHYAMASTALAQVMNLTVGSDVRLRNMTFRIVGLVEIEAGTLESGDTQPGVTPGNRLFLVPWSVPACWSTETVFDAARVDAIFIKGSAPAHFDNNTRRTRALMQQPDYAVEGLSWITPQSLIHRLMRYQRLIMLAGGTIVLLCLILGGLTLTSLLLTGVQTRVPEIGLRRALGASPADIGILFMCEALLITLSATVVGTGGAWILLKMTLAWSPLPVYLGATVAAIPLLSGIILGVIFSYWPARAAARISPSEALRNE
ncbi:MAG: ABC transporter permease [bacterium]